MARAREYLSSIGKHGDTSGTMRNSGIILGTGALALCLLWGAAVRVIGPSLQSHLALLATEALAAEGFEGLEVHAQGRDLTVFGDARPSPERERALEITGSVRGVRRVWDRIQPETPEGSSPANLTAGPDTPPEGGRTAADACQDEVDSLLADRRIQFEVSSAAIRIESHSLLDRLAASLSQCPNARVEVVGHTDSHGQPEFNQILSQARAESVRSYLITVGVHSDRLEARGLGATDPITTNDTEEGRAMNRRIEFIVHGL